MPDVFTKEKRSEIMRNIKGKDTNLEQDTAKMLRGAKLHYRSHPKMYGSPDFLVEGKLALFCDGSFWHGRDWKKLKARLEAGNNPRYWVKHIESNRKRDGKVNRAFRKDGQPFLRLWDTDAKKRPGWCIERIKTMLDDVPSGELGRSESGASDFVVIVGKKDEERFRRFAVGEDRVGMKSMEVLRGADRVWALPSRRTQDATWSSIHKNDHVFFARHGMPFSHVGTVSETLTDRSLATRLWGDTPRVRQLDRLVLFSSVLDVSKPFRDTCKLAGISPGSFTAIYGAQKRIHDPTKQNQQSLAEEPAGVVVLRGDVDDAVTLDADATGPPSRATEAVTRFLRDTKKVQKIKSKYRGKCQICGYVLRQSGSRTYSEVHHLRPLKDGGDDDFGNMLNLCAKHHVELDYLVIGISKDCKTVVGRDDNVVGTVTFSVGHKLARKNVMFHLKRMGMK